MTITITKSRKRLIVEFNKWESKYLYNKIECLSYGGRGNDNFSKALSNIFSENGGKLIKRWERKVYDEDNYGNRVDFGMKETREIWDLGDLFKSYNIQATDNTNSYEIVEFKMGM